MGNGWQAVSWRIDDESRPGQQRTVRGVDFGGDGPPILLHHANGFCAGTWGLVAPALTDRYHVYAMDARGHGDSDACAVPEEAEWIYFVADVVHVATAIARAHDVARLPFGIGSSFGGVVSAAAQARHGDLFEHLVLFDPPIHPKPELCAALGLPPPDPGGPERQQMLVDTTLRRRREWPSRTELVTSWQGKAMFEPWQDGGFELYLDYGFREAEDGTMTLKCNPEVEAHIFGTTGVLSPLEFGPKVKIPLELVRATEGFADATFFERLAGLFPQGTYHEMAGGHLLPLEVPDSCIQFLSDLS